MRNQFLRRRANPTGVRSTKSGSYSGYGSFSAYDYTKTGGVSASDNPTGVRGTKSGSYSGGYGSSSAYGSDFKTVGAGDNPTGATGGRGTKSGSYSGYGSSSAYGSAIGVGGRSTGRLGRIQYKKGNKNPFLEKVRSFFSVKKGFS